MKVLVVGAGAVGAVYGRHLQLGGAQVSFLVKEKYAAEIRGGMTFYLRNGPRSRHNQPVRMTGYGVVTAPQGEWDYVILTMSSTALRGAWLDELVKAIGDATVVTLQPGMHDRDYLLERVPAERVIFGTIPIVSYHGPLPGERLPEPGFAYWIPPFQSAGFKGNEARLQPLLKAFNQGGFSAKRNDDLEKVGMVPGTALSMFIAALEASHWSFAQLRKDHDTLATACAAMREGIAVSAREQGKPTPGMALGMMKPFLFKLIMTLSKRLVPFDFETYLRVHFTKVGEQMHQGLQDFIEAGRKASLPVQAIQQLATRVGA